MSDNDERPADTDPAQQAKMTELHARAERLEQELATARQESEARSVQAELRAEAVRAGMIDLDGMKLVDLSGVRLDPRGEVIGADEIMADLKRAKPWLFGSASSSTGAAPPAAQAPRQKLASEMSDAEYRAARAELLKRRS